MTAGRHATAHVKPLIRHSIETSIGSFVEDEARSATVPKLNYMGREQSDELWSCFRFVSGSANQGKEG